MQSKPLGLNLASSILIILMLFITGCNKEEPSTFPKKYSGKGKIYGELNKRKVPCRLVTVEKDPAMPGGWRCVFDDPDSEKHDYVSVGEHYYCPNMIYCQD